MMDSKLITGAFTTVAIIMTLGINVLLEDHYYICELTGVVKQFDKLSATGMRGYYSDSTGNHYKDCSIAWKPFTNSVPDPMINVSNSSTINTEAHSREMCDIEQCRILEDENE